ncbi:MAG: YqjK-like family protein [Candidatus Accumulibacter sp.]|jgi:hypothetical protein|nr:YqjK-like family protein [Accumulibacter sp.]
MPTLSELQIQRGRLLERVACQRAAMREKIAPVQRALDTADRAVAGIQAGALYLKRRPWMIGLMAAAVFALKGRRVFRLLKRGFILWRTWRSLRDNLSSGLGSLVF